MVIGWEGGWLYDEDVFVVDVFLKFDKDFLVSKVLNCGFFYGNFEIVVDCFGEKLVWVFCENFYDGLFWWCLNGGFLVCWVMNVSGEMWICYVFL